MPNLSSTIDLLEILRQTHTIGGADLLVRLQKSRATISRATMMRMVRELGGQVVVRGAARRTAYAARRPLRGNEAPMQLYRIDGAGRGSEIATLDPIYPHGCALRHASDFAWPLSPEMRDGWFPGLPYPLDDMRPQGFLGRNFAHACAATFQVAEDPRNWQEDDVLHVLSILGSDCPGDFILGEAAYRRHLAMLAHGYPAIADAQMETAYAEQALLAMASGAGNSSAGGEFPKFTACRVHNGNGEKIHVLVKFSGNDDTPSVRRWSDLLVCEHLAANAVARHLPLAAVRSHIHQCAGRTFLQVERFDRHGEFGRSAVCTWSAIDAALFGLAGATWAKAAARLREDGHISAESETDIVRLWHFGRLIANTDMHEGNIAFRPPSPAAPGMLTLAPVYDMLPMLYAPVRGVELPLRRFAPTLPLPGEREAWLTAAAAAIQFWQSAADDGRISADFRAVCAENGREVARLADAA